MKIKDFLKITLATALTLVLTLLTACGEQGEASKGGASSGTASQSVNSTEDERVYTREIFKHDSAPILRALVISDVHKQGGRLANAIKATWRYAQTQEYKGFDAVIIAGDLTDNGTDEELADLMTAYNNAVAATGQNITLISSMGNHEFGNKSHSAEENAQYVARFEKHVGHKANQEFDIKGIKFLALSPDNHAGDYTTATAYAIEKIKTYDKEKPVFVIQHHPFASTVSGSEEYTTSPLIREVISQYTNVIDLSGHSHSPITNLRTLYQQKNGYSAYNCGSFSNTLAMYSDVNGSGYYQSEQFSIFEVYPDNVTDVKLYDLATDKFLDTTYQIGAKVNNTLEFLKKATEKPYFKEGAKAEIASVGTTAVTVSFPQGDDDDKIEKYRVDVVDGSGKSVANSYVTSYYFRTDPPATLSQAVTGLKEGTEYTATVTAVDFYGNQSEPLKSAKFTTSTYPKGLTAVVQGKIFDSKNLWTGALTNVNAENGYFISSQGTGHYIVMDAKQNLNDKWMASVDYYRATYNLTDDFNSCSAMQIGPLALGVKRGSNADYLCLSYNYDALSGTSVFSNGLVIKKAELTSMLNATNRLTVTYEKGEVKVYRDGELAIHVTAAELKQKTGGTLPSFASSQIALRLNDTWVVNKAGATFENFELKK